MQERIPLNDIATSLAWPNHLARYQFALPFAAGNRVLDAGAGNGYGAALLKAQGKALSVTSIDLDAESIDLAQQRFAALDVNYCVHDCEDLDTLDQEFDVIVSFENIEHLQHPQRFLSGAARCLTPDGVLIISTPDRAGTPPFIDGKPANPHHVNEWYAGEFHRMLSVNYTEIELLSQVVTYAYSQVKIAQRAMNENFSRLEVVGRYSGFMRLRRLFGGVPARYVAPVESAVPRVEDYPIVSREVSALYGAPFCHVALCRGPIQNPVSNGD